MKNTDNALRSQALLLAMKALDIISKALDIIAVDDAATVDTPTDATADTLTDATADDSPADDSPADDSPVTTAPAAAAPVSPAETSPAPRSQKPSKPSKPSQPSKPSKPSKSSPDSADTYRADAIRFNEQFLRDHYDLRYNTMKKTTEFRPKSAGQLGARSSSPAPGSAVVSPALETSQAENKDTPTAVLRARTTTFPSAGETTALPGAGGDDRAPRGRDSLMTSTDIEELLVSNGLRPQDMPSPRQLTAALRAAGLRQGAQQGRHGWYAKAVEAATEKSRCAYNC